MLCRSLARGNGDLFLRREKAREKTVAEKKKGVWRMSFYIFAPKCRIGFLERRPHEARGLVSILWMHAWDQKGNHDWREFWNKTILFQNWGACVDTIFWHVSG
jgi:hypothetical protein